MPNSMGKKPTVARVAADFDAQHASWKDDSIKRRDPGAKIVLHDPSVPGEHAFAAFAASSSFAKPSGFLPLKAASSTLLCVCGSVPEFETVHKLLRMCKVSKPREIANITLKHFWIDKPDVSDRDALVSELTKELRSPSNATVVIVPLPVSMIPALAVEQIEALHDAAVAGRKQLFLFAPCPRDGEGGPIFTFAADTIMIERAEPNDGFDRAFTIDWVSLRVHQEEGRGKALVQVKRTNRHYLFDFSRFTAFDLVGRLIWDMTAKGYYRSKIIEITGLAHDEVRARQVGMRYPRAAEVKENWKAKYGDRFDFSALDE